MSDFLSLYLYFGIGLSALTVLATMILVIGRDLGNCPRKGPALQIGAVSVATGFVAIGLGAMILVAPAIDAFGDNLVGLFVTLGGVLISLGIGFTNAVAILRGLARDAAQDGPALTS